MEKIIRWLVIGGTIESVEAVKYLLSKGADVTVSVATEMGRTLYENDPISLWQGRMDMEGFKVKIAEAGITHVLDASHPFAKEVTREIREVCKLLEIPCFRYTRGDALDGIGPDKLPKIYRVKNVREAALLLSCLEGNILLTVGVQTLEIYRRLIPRFQKRCYARVMDHPDSIRACKKIFREESHWRAANPPFSREDNQKLIQETEARLLVTKDSGIQGGLLEKMAAAKQENVRVVLLERPEEADTLDRLEDLDIFFME